jgi:hypothetical protein
MRGQDDFEAVFNRLLGLSYRHARRWSVTARSRQPSAFLMY